MTALTIMAGPICFKKLLEVKAVLKSEGPLSLI